VGWFAFWAIYGSGFLREQHSPLSSALAGVFMMVILIEPLVDLAVARRAKTLA